MKKTAPVAKKKQKDVLAHNPSLVAIAAKQQGKSNLDNELVPLGNSSEATIYRRAVRMDLEDKSGNSSKRNSSSSDDNALTSNEEEQLNFQKFLDSRLKEFREGQQSKSTGKQPTKTKPSTARFGEDGQPQPSTSRGVEVPQDETMEERLDKMIREADANKASMNLVSGRNQSQNCQRLSGMFAHSMYVVEKYSMMGGQVDKTLKAKIVAGEYVDFAKLLPRDRLVEDEGLLQPIQRDGMMYFQSADKPGHITSFAKWEQAFRVFTHFYTEAFPIRGNELIQYNYVIHSASQTFAWDNVYAYDRDFRHHMSEFPDRSWGVILQQCWSMQLRERVNSTHNKVNHQGNGYGTTNSASKKSNVCWNYNRGKCRFGFNCKFEHKCSLCGKFGHGSFNCRRASSGGGCGRNGQNQNQGIQAQYLTRKLVKKGLKIDPGKTKNELMTN